MVPFHSIHSEQLPAVFEQKLAKLTGKLMKWMKWMTLMMLMMLQR
jgi:hypothetical protein